MYGFSDIVNLLGSAPGTPLHFRCGALGYQSIKTEVTTLEYQLKDL